MKKIPFPDFENAKQIIQLEAHPEKYPLNERRIFERVDSLDAWVFDLNSWRYDKGTAIYVYDKPIRRKIKDKMRKIAPAIVMSRSYFNTGYLILDETLTEIQRLRIGDIIKKQNTYYEIISFCRRYRYINLIVKSLVNDQESKLIFKKMRKMKVYDPKKVAKWIKIKREDYEKALKYMNEELNQKKKEKMIPRSVLGYQNKFRGSI